MDKQEADAWTPKTNTQLRKRVQQMRQDIRRGMLNEAMRKVRFAVSEGQREEIVPDATDVYVACRTYCEVYESLEAEVGQ